MAQFTKKAILDSFVELISERPFDKITVKDIGYPLRGKPQYILLLF